MANFKDYYKILGVSKNATDEEIKAAFRKLAPQYHPDTHPSDKNAEEQFKQINEAYQTLGEGRNLKGKRDIYNKIYDFYKEREAKEKEPVADTKQSAPERHHHTYRETPRASGTREGTRTNPNPIPPKRHYEDFEISDNDLGLLNALTEAHKAKVPGVWEVLRSDKDPRPWMPDRIYQVRREIDGSVHISRTVKDWRPERDEEIQFWTAPGSFVLDTKVRPADDLLEESYLFGKNKSLIYGLYHAPSQYGEFIDGMKTLAKIIAEGRVIDGKLDVTDDLIHKVNLYAGNATENNTAVMMEESPWKDFSGVTNEAEWGRKIAFDKLTDNVNEAGKFVHEVTNWRKEGNARPPQAESPHPRMPGEGRF